MNYFIFKIAFNRNVQTMHRQMFILSFLSVSLLLFVFFNSFQLSPKALVYIKNDQEQTNKSRIIQNGREPLIFSKYKYLNQTRQVKLF